MTASTLSPHWLADAACRELDPELFYDPKRSDEAVAVCDGCPVRAQCLDVVLALESRNRWHGVWGVWAGLTPDERRRMLWLVGS